MLVLVTALSLIGTYVYPDEMTIPKLLSGLAMMACVFSLWIPGAILCRPRRSR
jgi:hypothetical protein